MNRICPIEEVFGVPFQGEDIAGLGDPRALPSATMGQAVGLVRPRLRWIQPFRLLPTAEHPAAPGMMLALLSSS